MKTSIQAASMFLWLQLDWMSQGGNVEQHPSTLSVQEGDSSVINCTYSDSFSDYFPWYKQEPGQGLQLIIDIRSNLEKKQDQRLTVSLNKAAKHVSLHIAATQPGDSAVYFCVASTHCSPGIWHLYLILQLGRKPQLFSFGTDLLVKYLQYCLFASGN
uniref:Ig-like domain-containing protein n=1 Tax=Oryctolagus cuniculus TaxID=9986 RepID=A0A5F9DG44_RABIT